MNYCPVRSLCIAPLRLRLRMPARRIEDALGGPVCTPLTFLSMKLHAGCTRALQSEPGQVSERLECVLHAHLSSMLASSSQHVQSSQAR